MVKTINIPKNSWEYTAEDNRKRLSTRKAAVLMPFGVGSTGVEGTPLIGSSWDDIKDKMGVDNINKSLIDGFAENTGNAQFTVLPFSMVAATPATADFTISYLDPALPGDTNPTPSMTTVGNLVFAINENRYQVAVALYDTVDTLADAIIATIMSDGQIVATKSTITNGVTIDLKTLDTGETANQTSFEWLVNDPDWVTPGNATGNDPIFSGGTESTNLAEKIALYKTTLRNGAFTQFMSPYIDEVHLKEIYEGFNSVWYDQIVNNIQFVPMMHIVVISAETILDAQEYALQTANLSLAIIPEKDFKGDIVKRMGRANGSIFMKYQNYRIVNSMDILVDNLTPTNYWTEQEADTLIGLGLSPMGESHVGEPMIIRLVSSYKEANNSKPINMLTSVLGAIWFISGVTIFNDTLKGKQYILVNSRAGGNKITAAMISIELFNYINTNYAQGDDRIVDEFATDQVSVVKSAEDTVDCVITFIVPDGLTFMNTTFIQILGA